MLAGQSPLRLPTAVRTASTMTTSRMVAPCSVDISDGTVGPQTGDILSAVTQFAEYHIRVLAQSRIAPMLSSRPLITGGGNNASMGPPGVPT